MSCCIAVILVVNDVIACEIEVIASVIGEIGTEQTGELFFYYIPKGIIKRKPINVYEVPSKFNIEEEEYLRLVGILYDTIKELRE